MILITFYEFGLEDVKDLTDIQIQKSGVSDSHFLLEPCTESTIGTRFKVYLFMITLWPSHIQNNNRILIQKWKQKKKKVQQHVVAGKKSEEQ